jgi:glutamate-1-semialdehyde 2,1-aminomutase
MAQRITRSLFRKAEKCLVGGVSSPVRAFGYVGGNPVLVKRARGSKVFDYDGNEYIDYVLSWGASILGHNHPDISSAVKKALVVGLGFGTTHQSEIELAVLIKEAIPFIDKIRFVNSGTEAVMGAVRLARGYTGRDKIIKFEHAYHGHADYLLAKAGSGLATLSIPFSSGVPRNFLRHTLIAKSGDKQGIADIFRKYAGQIAAVIIEPVGGNFGVVPPDLEFLGFLRSLTRRSGTLLIADEVITGFRFCFGAATQEFGIEPDLICLGKIIGGGLPIGAYAGKKEIMNYLAPLGKVYQASTFSGNPVLMQAGLAALKNLKKNPSGYTRTRDFTEFIILNLLDLARKKNIELETAYFTNIFSVKFRQRNLFRIFYRALLRQGVYLAPSEYEANFLSFAHTHEDIEKTIAAARQAFKRL